MFIILLTIQARRTIVKETDVLWKSVTIATVEAESLTNFFPPIRISVFQSFRPTICDTFYALDFTLPGLRESRVAVQEIRLFPGPKRLQFSVEACTFDLRGYGREACVPGQDGHPFLGWIPAACEIRILCPWEDSGRPSHLQI
jgi:hypothetical protein